MMRKTERGGKEKGNFVNGIAKIAEEKKLSFGNLIANRRDYLFILFILAMTSK